MTIQAVTKNGCYSIGEFPTTMLARNLRNRGTLVKDRPYTPCSCSGLRVHVLQTVKDCLVGQPHSIKTGLEGVGGTYMLNCSFQGFSL